MNPFDEKMLKTSPRLLARIMAIGDEPNKGGCRWSFYSERQVACSAFDPGRWRKQWTGKSGARMNLWE
jgi:hypothetical protein